MSTPTEHDATYVYENPPLGGTRLLVPLPTVPTTDSTPAVVAPTDVVTGEQHPRSDRPLTNDVADYFATLPSAGTVAYQAEEMTTQWHEKVIRSSADSMLSYHSSTNSVLVPVPTSALSPRTGCEDRRMYDADHEGLPTPVMRFTGRSTMNNNNDADNEEVEHDDDLPFTPSPYYPRSPHADVMSMEFREDDDDNADSLHMHEEQHFASPSFLTIEWMFHLFGFGKQWALLRSFSPSITSDLSECVRLFIGSSITVFPFIVALGGTIGSYFLAVPVIFLLQECANIQLDVKYVAVETILKRLKAHTPFSKPPLMKLTHGVARGSPGTATQSPCHVGDMSRTLSNGSTPSMSHCHSMDALIAPNSHNASPTEGSRHVALSMGRRVSSVAEFDMEAGDPSSLGDDERVAQPLPALSPMHRTRSMMNMTFDDEWWDRYTSIGSYLKLSQVLWTYPTIAAGVSTVQHEGVKKKKRTEVRGHFPLLVRVVILIAQFISSCVLTMFTASNANALLGNHMSLPQCIFASCVVLTLLATIYVPRTYAAFASVNNGALLGAAVVLVVATVTHQNAVTTDDSTDATWTMPKQFSDAVTFVPLVIYYLSPALFIVQVENSIARRCITSVKKKMADAEDIVARRRIAKEFAMMKPGALLDRFYTVLFVAVLLSSCALFGFGEFIFAAFKSQTNAVVALSLRDGLVRNVLLIDLLVGLLACTVVNIGGVIQMINDMKLAKRIHTALRPPSTIVTATTDGQHNPRVEEAENASATLHPTFGVIEKALLFMIWFSIVYATLRAIPFFDLVASLGGTVGKNLFTFFLPCVMRLQAIRRESEGPNGDVEPIGWWEAFCSVPTRRGKAALIALATTGSGVLVFGLKNFVEKLQERLAV